MSSFGDKKYASLLGTSPIGFKKMLPSSIEGMTRFSGKEENHSVSVISNFFPDHLKIE